MKQDEICTPILILGAPRSGTNILRDCLSIHPSITTWDCDEINAVWKYQNYEKHDDLKIDDLTPEISDFIRSKFSRLANRSKSKYVVEKTCANSLRPAFVSEILPNAKFILIFRNGDEVVPSIIKRTNGVFGGSKIKYRLKKLRYVPLSYLSFTMFKVFCSNAKLKLWGPTTSIVDMHNCNIEERAFIQWSGCVNATIDYFQHYDRRMFFALNYTSLIAEPDNTLRRLFEFLDIEIDAMRLQQMQDKIEIRNRNADWVFSSKTLSSKAQLVNSKIKRFLA